MFGFVVAVTLSGLQLYWQARLSGQMLPFGRTFLANLIASLPWIPLGAFILWLAGRVAMWFSGAIDPWIVAVFDLAFIPVLAIKIAVQLIRRPKPQNMIFLAFLAFIWIANLLTHLEWMGLTDDTLETGLRAGVLSLFDITLSVSAAFVLANRCLNALSILLALALSTPLALIDRHRHL